MNENPGGPRDEAGFWTSVEGRFGISPNYRHTVYPDSYTVTDRLKNERTTLDRVRDCKAWALARICAEHATETLR